jgi:hypothetical protein
MKPSVFLSLTVVVLLLSCPAGLKAQQPFNFVASPMLSQSGRANANLSHYTGKLGISVPIYSYKSTSSNLSLDIGLNYSGGALDVLQNASSVGSGWQLAAGGSIFRSINGLPDDRYNSQTPGYFYGSGYIPDNPCCINYQAPGKYDDPVNKTHLDSEADDYYFDMNGRSGKLAIPQDIINTGSLTAIQTIPQSTVQTYFSQGAMPPNTTTSISEFIMVDESGVEYHFGAVETMQKKIPTLNSDGGNNYHYSYTWSNEYYATAWRVTKMIDRNTGDEIDFNYTSYNVSYKVPNYPTTYTNLGNQNYSVYDDGQDMYKGTAQRLTSIQFKNGEQVNFIYDPSPRLDFVSDEALLQIQVTSPIAGHQMTYNLKQSFLMEQYDGGSSYETIEVPNEVIGAGGGGDRLTTWFLLKTITQLSADGTTELPIASFGYNRPLGVYTGTTIPTRFSGGASDLWGNASPGTQFAMMDTVFNINGGYSYYQFEPNDDLMSDGTTGMPGGWRVKSVTKFDGVNHSNDVVTSYTYQTTAGKSSGFTTTPPPNYYQNALLNNSGGSDNYAVTMTYNSGMVPPTMIQGGPVGYGRVTETTPGNGSTVYEFTTTADYAPLYTTLNYPFANKPMLADWAYGLPKMTTVFDQNGVKVQTMEHDYNVVITPLSTQNFRSMKMAYRTEATGYVFGSQTCTQTASTFNFTYEFYYPTTGIAQLAQTIATDYPPNGRNLVNTTQYTYDPTYFVVTRATGYNSKGEKIENIPFYLFQTTNTVGTPYGYARAYNLLSSPYGNIAILTKTDGTKYILSYGKVNYQVVNSVLKPSQTLSAKLAAPVSIDPSKNTFTPDENYGLATSSLAIDQSYDLYDAIGNLVQASDPTHNRVSSSVWDYSVQKQIAQCNTGYNTIDYTSFENNQTGNWTISSGSVNTGGVTGVSAFTGTLTKNQSLPGNYILTLWNSSGTSVSVNGSSGTVLLSRGGYDLRTWTLSSVSSITVTGTNIDELRLYPQGAQMATCTYSPLVGITSACDVNNRISYYEYDGFNRLQDVRDQDGNIIRTIEYHYKGH